MVLQFAVHNIIYEGWNKWTTQTYLKSYYVPDQVIDKMYTKFKKMSEDEDKDGKWYRAMITHLSYGYQP